jgi:hypothetical protein
MLLVLVRSVILSRLYEDLADAIFCLRICLGSEEFKCCCCQCT